MEEGSAFPHYCDMKHAEYLRDHSPSADKLLIVHDELLYHLSCLQASLQDKSQVYHPKLHFQ